MSSEANPLGLTVEELAEALREEAGSLLRENRALILRYKELEALLHECNAVCLCGCPNADHEADECGESCGHDDHECIRVPRAVLAYAERLRAACLLDRWSFLGAMRGDATAKSAPLDLACPVCRKPLAEWYATDVKAWAIGCTKARKSDHQFYVQRKRRQDARRIARRVAV